MDEIKNTEGDFQADDDGKSPTMTIHTSTSEENIDLIPLNDDDEVQQNDVIKPSLSNNLKHFSEHLSDAGKFSYLGLCSTVLTLLYFDDFDTEYRHKVVRQLVDHVKLESQPLPTMLALCDGHGFLETDVFVDNLNNEDVMKEEPIAIAEDLVLWSLVSSATKDSAGGRYDARTRILIRHITWRLHIQLEQLESVEEKMVKLLQEDYDDKDAKEQAAQRNRQKKRRKWKSYAMIGLAAAGGGAIIGLTGGLAAPLVAAGAGAVLGASTAAALGSVAGIAIITSVFGAAGAGLTGYKMKRRVGGIDQFLFRPLTAGKQLAVTVAISGWLSSKSGEGDFTVPWLSLRQSEEQYCLVWEAKHLQRLGGAFEYIIDSLLSVAASEALKYTVLSGLLTAIAWPASLLACASVIDNPWSVCLQRSIQVGKELAEVLLARQHGHRPITLIGYSLGARVIYYCLEEMSKRKNHSGIVEDVILLGTPVTGEPEQWQRFAKVVAGHITNGYCKSDWLLRFLYRTSSGELDVAGLQPVKWNDRRMINIDLSSIVEGHLDYRKRMSEILSAVGVRNEKDALHVASLMSDNPRPMRSESCPVVTDTKPPSSGKTRSETIQAIHSIDNNKDEPTSSNSKTISDKDENKNDDLLQNGNIDDDEHEPIVTTETEDIETEDDIHEDKEIKDPSENNADKTVTNVDHSKQDDDNITNTASATDTNLEGNTDNGHQSNISTGNVDESTDELLESKSVDLRSLTRNCDTQVFPVNHIDGTIESNSSGESETLLKNSENDGSKLFEVKDSNVENDEGSSLTGKGDYVLSEDIKEEEDCDDDAKQLK